MTPEIESLKKEARESFLGDCPIPKCSACRVDGILIDELVAKAFLAGEKSREEKADRPGCSLSGKERGDCRHAVGMVEETDHFGKPIGWCWWCWHIQQIEEARTN